MADFLIKNTDHWMDTLTPEQIQQANIEDPSFQKKYDRRIVKGDVLAVGENNRWLDHQHGNGKFLIIRCPFITVEQAQEYTKDYMVDNEIIANRKYRMWFENITSEQFEQYNTAPYVYRVNTQDELSLFGQDKESEA